MLLLFEINSNLLIADFISELEIYFKERLHELASATFSVNLSQPHILHGMKCHNLEDVHGRK